MKALTKFLLPRYTWFLFWYKQWFRNPQGIKGFAHQIMNWLMQSTLKLADKLKKENKKLSERIKEKGAMLAKKSLHFVIEADEYDDIRDIVNKLGFWVTIGIIAESVLNYFAVASVITSKGWMWIPLKAILALALTGLSVYLFKKWFAVILNKPKYKQPESHPRSWIDFIVLALLCVTYEALFYYLCKIRGVALEGGLSDSIVTNFVVITGMLLPLVAGYLMNERSLYLSPYRNTLRIEDLEKDLAKWNNTIAANNQRMENHFKKQLQHRWAMLQEFKVYKENFNIKNGMAHVNMEGHFSETQESFTKQAVERYKTEVINTEVFKPAYHISDQQKNSYQKNHTSTLVVQS